MAKLDRLSADLLASNPRASLPAWIRYSSIALAAFREHPRAYIYTPSNMSPATVVSRLRDAVRGAIAFDYPIGETNAQDFSKWFASVIFKVHGASVYIGPKESVVEAIEGSSVTGQPSVKYHFESLTREEFEAFLLLLSRGRISGPVLIKTPAEEFINHAPVLNVEILPRPDGALILL